VAGCFHDDLVLIHREQLAIVGLPIEHGRGFTVCRPKSGVHFLPVARLAAGEQKQQTKRKQVNTHVQLVGSAKIHVNL